MQEGDVQIKGYPIRLPLDVALVFSANPEDYTARGKIITPLKDRIGSEIRTHYPATIEEGIAITAQEAWTRRNGNTMHLPQYVQQVIERIAFAAREDKKIDKRSGVSQRLPISAMENVISNAERRAIRNRERFVVPRVSDIYAALPAITGKLELEYEGEMKGADFVGRELIRSAIAKTYDEYYTGANVQQIVQWFDLGGEIQLSDSIPASEALENLKGIQGLTDKLGPLGISQKDSAEQQVSARGVHSGRPARAQAHWTQRRARVQGRREEARTSTREIVRCGENGRIDREGNLTKRRDVACNGSLRRSPTVDARRSKLRLYHMKRIRYSKYVPDPAGEMSMEDLLGALSDYLLQSGFQDSMWYEMPEGEHTLDALKRAIEDALMNGEMFDEELREQIEQMMADGQLDELIQKLIERMQQEDYISSR